MSSYYQSVYGNGWFGRYIWQPVIGFLWIALLLGAAYNHVKHGQPNPWGIPVLLTGFVLFLISKISVIRGGKLFSAGYSATSRMSKKMIACYVGGYLLMLAGFILSF